MVEPIKSFEQRVFDRTGRRVEELAEVRGEEAHDALLCGCIVANRRDCTIVLVDPIGEDEETGCEVYARAVRVGPLPQ